jgi:hypothetical protein
MRKAFTGVSQSLSPADESRFSCATYKQRTEACGRARRAILRGLWTELPWVTVPDDYVQSDDCLDSLIASLTTRAAAQSLSFRPETSKHPSARREGWIHLPTGLPQP